MSKISPFIDKAWKIKLWLFAFSFAFYFVYFHPIFLNLNSFLSFNTADSLKNYFTYVYHIKNDPALLHFTGMNFPYGEHIIYTDCQPLFTFILRLFPFAYNYSIGILHFIIFFSLIITPVICYSIFERLDIDRFSAFLISIAIAILTPQFMKIHVGHFALIYACVFPLSILFILKYLQQTSAINAWKLFLYNAILFSIHPYLALGACLLTLFSLVFNVFFTRQERLKHFSYALWTGIIPILLFKVFMLLTDHHKERPTTPEGVEYLDANLGSLILPHFGPFREILSEFFKVNPPVSEGYSYVGLFMLISSIIFILLFPVILRKQFVKKEIFSVLVASVIILMFAFGFHFSIMNYFKIQSPSLNQFRATGRFAWIFYYVWPVFIFTTFYFFFKTAFKKEKVLLFRGMAILYLVFNLIEANALYTLDKGAFWIYRNFFSEKYLNANEINMLETIREKDPQAIIPLPVFHSGSEVVNRGEYDRVMIPSFIYSYHAGLPVLSVLMSRTSIPETENSIQLLNAYKKEKTAVQLLNGKPILIIRSDDRLVPDEERLYQRTTSLFKNDSLEIGFLTQAELLKRPEEKNKLIIPYRNHLVDSLGVLFIKNENQKPFLTANLADQQTICVLDSNEVRPGNYIFSLHYYPEKKTFKYISCHLVIRRGRDYPAEWIYNGGVRKMSGFYNGFGVFEDKFTIEPGYKYDFMLTGLSDKTYRISDFMLRPEHLDIIAVNGRDTVFNNFPD
jgi:hypothetical protein